MELDYDGQGSLDDRRRRLYSNLFYVLQSEPRHIAGLTRIVQLNEIDTLLQTVMFTLFGNQYETREEYLLLSMFQVLYLTRMCLLPNSKMHRILEV
jgi:Ras GTPase-activating-like protein IQGAP2/3